MDQQIIQHSLAGRRFAVIGFESSEADTIIEALGTARGVGHMVAPAPGIPGLNCFSPFDACFINASLIGVGEQLAPIEMLARSRKPAVIVGYFDDLVRRFPAVADINREFVLRPYQPQDLLLRAFRVLRFVESAEAIKDAPVHNGARRVVVADDDRSTATLLTTILKHFHFSCEVAHNGAEALELARKKRPDLVMLDISMPQMDGFEALSAMRNDMATRSTPVILVTSHTGEADVVKGFALGAADYVTKPFTSGELMARVNRVLREPEEF
jgi:CheY-like chemotaxis protein